MSILTDNHFKEIVKTLRVKKVSIEKHEIQEDDCSYCQSVNCILYNTNRSAKICSICGSHKKELIDLSAEKKNYMNSSGDMQNNSRCSGPTNPNLPKSSLGTSISSGSKGRMTRKVANMIRIQRWNAMPYHEKRLWQIFKQIDVICSNNGLPKNIGDEAKRLYQLMKQSTHTDGKNKGKKVITRGDIHEAIKAYCIYLGCQNVGAAKDPKEVEQMCKIKKGHLSIGRKRYHKIVKLDDIEATRASPIDFIKNFCHKLSIGNFYRDIIIHIFNKAIDMKLINQSNHISMASSCITLVNEIYILNIDKELIANVCNITNVTINKTYNKIVPYLYEMLPDPDKIKVLIKINKGSHAFQIQSRVHICKSI